jgi:hypothetical protein
LLLIELIATGKTTLSLATPLLPAPGVWTPKSPLPEGALGALTTPPLGWEWDGGAVPLVPRPGALVWSPPRRPLDRFLAQLAARRYQRPLLVTLAADEPGRLTKAVELVEARADAQGLILWWSAGYDLLLLVVATRSATLLPLFVELPAELAPALAPTLLAAGIDGLLIGPPTAVLGATQAGRLWGPATLPLVQQALARTSQVAPTLPLIAAAGVASPADAVQVRAVGALAIALGPEWWLEPDLASRMLAVFE